MRKNHWRIFHQKIYNEFEKKKKRRPSTQTKYRKYFGIIKMLGEYIYTYKIEMMQDKKKI